MIKQLLIDVTENSWELLRKDAKTQEVAAANYTANWDCQPAQYEDDKGVHIGSFIAVVLIPLILEVDRRP